MKYLLILILLFNLSFCAGKKEPEATGLLLAILENKDTTTTEDKALYKSILTMEVQGWNNFTGECQDTFYGISAYDYYSLHFNSKGNIDTYKTGRSKKSCADLGFSGGIISKSKEGFQMSTYRCGFNTKTCSSKASTELGFK